jgi:hypothetical protein
MEEVIRRAILLHDDDNVLDLRRKLGKQASRHHRKSKMDCLVIQFDTPAAQVQRTVRFQILKRSFGELPGPDRPRIAVSFV